MVTLHSIERTKERAGLNWNGAVKMIENAYHKGQSPSDFGAKERQYLRLKENGNKTVKLYAGYCFLFNENGICITMYKVPTWFGKTRYDGKIELKNAKKYYCKYYSNREERNCCEQQYAMGI